MTGQPTIQIVCTCGRPMIRGPRGGGSQNFYCTDREKCRQGYNLTIITGEIVFCQPIGEIDDVLYRKYVGVLH